MENIGLQDSLLSRFDLLFVMLDTIDNDNDQRIADFVVRMHRYRNPKEQDGEVLPMGGNYAEFLTTFNLQNENDGTKDMQIFEKYDALLHGDSRTRSEQVLSVQFMRKYIHLAKCLKPRLTQEASDVIANEYSRLRSQDDDSHMARTQPVTARTLETLIRLSTAHAKARMGKTISVADAKAAIELVQFAYFKKVLEKEKRKRRRSEDGDDSDVEDDEHDDENAVSQPSQGTRKSKRTKTTDASETMDTEDIDDTPIVQPVDAGDLTKRATRKSVGRSTQQSSEGTTSTETATSPDFISQDRLLIFKQKLNQAFRDVREQTLAVEALTGAINQNIEQPFTPAEVNAAIEQMSEANQIMVADGIVFLI